MIYAIIGLFTLAALTGIGNFIFVSQKKQSPRALVYTHGALAATGLILLIVFAVQNVDANVKVPIGLFVATALGGFYLFYRDVATKQVPILVAALHALLAVGSFTTLLLFAFAS